MFKIRAKESYSSILIGPLDGLHSVAALVYLECGASEARPCFGSLGTRFQHIQSAVAAALCRRTPNVPHLAYPPACSVNDAALGVLQSVGRGHSRPGGVGRRRAASVHIHVADGCRGAHRREHKDIGCLSDDLRFHGPMDLCSRDSCNQCVSGPQGFHYRLSTTTFGYLVWWFHTN